LLQRYLALWSLVPEGEPFETPSSRILYVASPQGPAVLKLFKPPREEARSPLALRHYDGAGAVRLIAHDEQAMLTRRALPGTPLSDLVRAGRDDEATDVVCDVAAALHGRGAAPGGWITVEEWGMELHAQCADRLPRDLVRAARGTFDALCRSQSSRVLLHGDLHHDNILRDDALGWLAIDPKCLLGEREYELGAALRNPAGLSAFYADPHVMQRRISRMCDRLGFAAERVLRWCFAQAVLAAVWCAQDADEAATVPTLKVAETSLALLRH